MVLWQNNIYFELFDKYFDSFAVNFTNSTSGLPVMKSVLIIQFTVHIIHVSNINERMKTTLFIICCIKKHCSSSSYSFIKDHKMAKQMRPKKYFIFYKP